MRQIIGQAPSRDGAGAVAPFSGRSGAFLARLAGAEDFDDVRRLAQVENVLARWPGKRGKGDAFPILEARAAAARLKFGGGDAVLFVGRGSAAACGFRAPFLAWRTFRLGRAAVFPHPSGVNRWWNDAGNRQAAGRFLRAFLGGRSMARQLLIGGALGAPPGIPKDQFVTVGQSKPGAVSKNGYLIVGEVLLRSCPWGAWAALREAGERLRVAWDAAGNRALVLRDPRGSKRFGRMAGWISDDAGVLLAKEHGLVAGRQPARWEEGAVLDGAVVPGWSLVVYPTAVRQ